MFVKTTYVVGDCIVGPCNIFFYTMHLASQVIQEEYTDTFYRYWRQLLMGMKIF